MFSHYYPFSFNQAPPISPTVGKFVVYPHNIQLLYFMDQQYNPLTNTQQIHDNQRHLLLFQPTMPCNSFYGIHPSSQHIIPNPSQLNPNLVQQIEQIKKEYSNDEVQSHLNTKVSANQDANLREQSNFLRNLFIEPKCIKPEQIENIKKNTPTLQIEHLLRLIVADHGKNDQNLLQIRQQIGRDIPEFSQLYDALTKKFTESRKNREEIVKYIMRKAFKYLFQRIQKQSKKTISQKTAHRQCLKIYFQGESNVFLDVLPFRRNSKIRTMSLPFLEIIFNSQAFATDYSEFLKHFKSISDEDNERKIINIAKILTDYYHENSFNKIKKLRRMPWSHFNLENAQKVSVQLLKFHGKQLNDGEKTKPRNQNSP